eukprot:scaffold2653_cov176-Ochromonas_danica.AAC.8
MCHNAKSFLLFLKARIATMYGMKEYGMSSWSAIASHMDGQTADSCEKRWTRSFDPAFDRSMWTAQEDAIIKMVVLDDIQQERIKPNVSEEGQVDEARGRHLARGCQATWYKGLDADWKLSTAIRQKAVLVKISEQDAELVFAVRQFGDSGHWSAIAAVLSTSRSGSECKVRWERELRRGLNTTAWTKEEDNLLLFLRQQGLGYDKLFPQFKGRTVAAIAQRCVDLGVAVKPAGKSWSKEEVELLMQLVDKQKASGKRLIWKLIAQQMPLERTARACSRAHFKHKNKEKRREEGEVEEVEKSPAAAVEEHDHKGSSPL